MRRLAPVLAVTLVVVVITSGALVWITAHGHGPRARQASSGPTGTRVGTAPAAIPPVGTGEEHALYTALMVGDHDGELAGVPGTWSWAHHAEVDNPSNGALPSMTAWGQVYAAAGVAEPPVGAVRVEIKGIRSYIWSRSRGAWVLVQDSEGVAGMHYLNDFRDGLTEGADLRSEADGGTSVSMVPGYNFHFWPVDGRAKVAPGDVAAVITTFKARLIGPGAASAAYLANAGGDWWRTMTAAFDFSGPDGNNDQIGEGRFVALSPAWTTVGFYTGGP